MIKKNKPVSIRFPVIVDFKLAPDSPDTRTNWEAPAERKIRVIESSGKNG